MSETEPIIYDYYRCFKRKDKTCPSTSIVEKDIRSQLIDFFEVNFRTSPVLAAWLREHADVVATAELKERLALKGRVEKETIAIEQEGLELIRMRAKQYISDEELSNLRNELDIRKKKLNTIDTTQSTNTIERLKKVVSLSEMCTAIMTKGFPEEKREFLSQICSNLVLTGKNVTITMLSEIEAFVEGLERVKEENPLFEPTNILDTSSQNSIFVHAIPSLLPR